MTIRIPSVREVTHMDFPLDFSSPVEELFNGKINRLVVRRTDAGYVAELWYAHGGIARGRIPRPTIDRAITDLKDHLLVADHSFAEVEDGN